MRNLIARLLVVVVLVGACSGPIVSTATSGPTTPAASPGPTSSLDASLQPSASPAAASPAPPTPPTAIASQVFPPGAAIKVAVRELNVRKKPSTSSKRLEILKRGDVLIVSPTDQLSFGWGPVKADGYTWYPVMRPNVVSTDLDLDPLPKPPIDVADGSPFWGWLATDDGTRPYVTAIAPRCPTTVDLLNVSGMLPAERLACFPEPFVLQGTYGCAGCGAVSLGSFKPAWLATPVELDFLSVNPAERLGPLALRFAPNGPSRPAAGSILRVTVHVDDSRSDRCTMSELVGEELVAIDPRTAVLYCRERLVVDSYDVLGIDPSFPPG
jgi:hypothetical protein